MSRMPSAHSQCSTLQPPLAPCYLAACYLAPCFLAPCYLATCYRLVTCYFLTCYLLTCYLATCYLATCYLVITGLHNRSTEINIGTPAIERDMTHHADDALGNKKLDNSPVEHGIPEVPKTPIGAGVGFAGRA